MFTISLLLNQRYTTGYARLFILQKVVYRSHVGLNELQISNCYNGATNHRRIKGVVTFHSERGNETHPNAAIQRITCRAQLSTHTD